MNSTSVDFFRTLTSEGYYSRLMPGVHSQQWASIACFLVESWFDSDLHLWFADLHMWFEWKQSSFSICICFYHTVYSERNPNLLVEHSEVVLLLNDLFVILLLLLMPDQQAFTPTWYLKLLVWSDHRMHLLHQTILLVPPWVLFSESSLQCSSAVMLSHPQHDCQSDFM